MKIGSTLVSCGAVVCAMIFGTLQVSAGAMVRTQTPCVDKTLGYCLAFFGPSPTIPVIRAFNFNAPSAGTAEVIFHGSLFCSNHSVGVEEVVDLAAQIVTAGSAVPDPNGPGGLRLAEAFAAPKTITLSDTFNLASTRVVTIPAAGAKKFLFKISVLRMDPQTACYVYNAAFSVVFIP